MSLRAAVSEYHVRLERAPENAHRRWSERQGLLLTLEYEGDVGQGEAAPLPGYARDSLPSARHALAELDFSSLPDPAELGRVELARFVTTPGLTRSPAARFAVEAALLDLRARRRGLPLHQSLREDFAWDGPAPEGLPLAALIDDLSMEAALARSDAALRAGFAALKFKIGRPGRFAEELELLTALRSRHPAVALRLDANGAFSPEEAPRALAELAAFHPELIEEPLRFGAPPLRDPCVPVAFDESLVDGFELDRDRARARGLVALVLKPGPLGGLFTCWELAERARRAGLGVIVSHAFEGPVAYAAAIELALALGSGPYAHGLAPHAALAAWPSAPGPAGLAGARLEPHARGGTGLPRTEVPFA